ncbi:TonB-dependent receptor plug domain-containing protein [Massilia phyllosphaerae]|uniref:TonB-dependent receptor plug domain-containing protein n=1 Tax=Massilia phyllosphaerae TaxID=3106034 RepID=UPI002B1CC57C|nr:TonB-dependent receptor [Massilia sp. SGZ-792]
MHSQSAISNGIYLDCADIFYSHIMIYFKNYQVVFAILAPVSAVQAQEVAEKIGVQGDGTAQNIRKVEIRANSETYIARRDDTAAKIIVGQEEINKYGETNIVDVLKRVPGITVTGGEIQMRGLGAGYTQILVDGERTSAGFSLDSIPPSIIERVEILRSATAEFSTQSIAGTINIVLKRKIKNNQDQIKLDARRGAGWTGGFGTIQLSDRFEKFSYLIISNLLHEGKTDEIEYLTQTIPVGLLNEYHENYRVIKNVNTDFFNIVPRLTWNLENGNTIAWQSFLNFGKTSSIAQTRTTGRTSLSLRNKEIADNTYKRNLSFRTEVNWTKKLDNGGEFNSKISGLYAMPSNDYAGAYLPNGDYKDASEVIKSKSREKNIASMGKLKKPLFKNHSIDMGWELRHIERKSQENDVIKNSSVNLSLNSYNSAINQTSVYLQDDWEVHENAAIYLGARWEGINTRALGAKFEEIAVRSAVFSPIFQTLWKPFESKDDQLRLAVTRTYKAPTLEDIIPLHQFAVQNNQNTPDREGNPHLRPELALGVDTSYEHYWSKDAMFSVSASTRNIKDYSHKILLEKNGRWVTTTENIGSARTYSLEIESRFPILKNIGKKIPLDMRISVNKNWSKVASIPFPENRVAEQVPLSANLGVDYKANAFATGANFVFKSVNSSRVSLTQTIYSGTTRDINAYALWKLDPKTQFRTSVSTSLNQRAVTSSIYQDGVGSSTRQTLGYPERPTVRAVLEVKF